MEARPSALRGRMATPAHRKLRIPGALRQNQLWQDDCLSRRGDNGARQYFAPVSLPQGLGLTQVRMITISLLNSGKVASCGNSVRIMAIQTALL